MGEPSEVGRVIGRYVLYDAIAAGGMATVHLGRLMGQVGFARVVAIKRLHPHLAKDPDFVAMFLDEARVAAGISHPNVVSTVDVVALEGELFLVMEYVEGDSLSHLIRDTRRAGLYIEPAIVSAVISQACYGLHAAHTTTDQHGRPLHMVHRDVSPQNIQIGVDGVSRVLDFGVAKAARRLQETEAGRLKGKFSYMAPEMVRHDSVDHRADVFSAGICLWEALTGKFLFHSEEPGRTIGKVLDMPIPPPSTVVPGIPPSLDEVVARALERSPDKRYQTARELAIAIEDAVPPAISRKVGEWVERYVGPTLKQRNKRLAELAVDVVPAGPTSVGELDRELKAGTPASAGQLQDYAPAPERAALPAAPAAPQPPRPTPAAAPAAPAAPPVASEGPAAALPRAIDPPPATAPASPVAFAPAPVGADPVAVASPAAMAAPVALPVAALSAAPAPEPPPSRPRPPSTHDDDEPTHIALSAQALTPASGQWPVEPVLGSSPGAAPLPGPPPSMDTIPDPVSGGDFPALGADFQAAPPPEPWQLTPAGSQVAPETRTPISQISEVSVGSYSGPLRTSLPPRLPVVKIAIAGGALALLLLIGVVVAVSSGSKSQDEKDIEAVGAKPPATATAKPPVPDHPVDPPPSKTVEPPPTVEPSATAKPVASVAPKPSATTAKTPSTATTPPKPPVGAPGISKPADCNPPYTIDANGIKKFKRHCL